MKSSGKFSAITVGIVLQFPDQLPSVVVKKYRDMTYEEAKDTLLSDVTVNKHKLNNDVFVTEASNNIPSGGVVTLKV